MDKLLDKKVCLVTGAANGIGKSIVERFASEGAIVFANDLIGSDMNDWSVSLSEKYATKIIPICFDITEFKEVKAAITRIKKEYGRIDVLVNNAGIVTYEMLPMIDFAKLQKMFDVNVMGLIHLIQMVSKLMVRQSSGSIINMASLVGLKGAKGQLAYSATKGAVIATTLSASKELASYNIRVNAVAPGMVATERFLKEIEGRFEDRLTSVGMGRYALPSEVADAFVFFASDMSKYVTGQVMQVEGSFAI
ncbi:SDR family NAD(P)-dependent oxidoreductase [Bacteroides sp. AM07-18]|jgi:3-oxoacyl-[acyl-carrier protein] reductase|uniref:SDR family NAD(P)-dependent oxidoreductase n=1 Tax=Bacteroides uniformis TaxID=820 RepID=A0A414JTX0_BACUN|nr:MULTISPECIES: SDR family oxidoreductase [Bacteroides]RGD54883.1 SDR family NAD(P)-dependent oxidoreductase [Bacteroides sp. AM07-18]RHE62098.1 SDR family NAD(P)-dependent oxidoreductase [Bacteroides uniformis]RJU30097.1 SDR family NAD(P)-dependent oxidoreductase [Bacteroides sp. AM51-7]RJU79447.1 SDR family NAD(P)-dependent oxidoreductase [Bacteroides sp. AM26-2]